MGPATSMPNMRLFFPGYTWIDIVHDSEGSLIMYHGFVYEALLSDFTNIESLWLQYLFLWNLYILFLRYYSYIDKILFTLFILLYI